ncbi:hypothetical protein [Saccharothrix sp. HUAS TT1]|uniref:WDGH domain-containing protein n=1 Tax=Saccharothrix sp. HUAS TT1 TaxID=3231910 RepID=UPI00345BC282
MSTPLQKLALPIEQQLDEVYRERARLAAVLAALFPAVLCDHDPTFPDRVMLYIDTPAGQISYHIDRRELDLFDHVPQVDPDSPDAPVWDRHTTEEKDRRLKVLARQLAPSGALPATGTRATLVGPDQQVVTQLAVLGQALRVRFPAVTIASSPNPGGTIVAVVDVDHD